MQIISFDLIPAYCYNDNNTKHYSNRWANYGTMQENKPKRDYKREYQLNKEKDKAKYKLIGVKVTRELEADFSAKCELNGTTKNGLIKKWIEEYTYKK